MAHQASVVVSDRKSAIVVRRRISALTNRSAAVNRVSACSSATNSAEIGGEQDVPLVAVEAAIPRLPQSDDVGHGRPPLGCGSADARRLQSRRAAAAQLCVQPFYSLPTGLMLPEPAGG